ncbi:regulatory protein RecX [Prevotella sp. KH2C16]|uniref:regulatory protein RecX n=1 Tax=Prevotella sp. KH2C16 TaxID=1855325 RepID=UPI000B845CDB|nr:regulatory protein RecX [Prevotella sp. KH2C16]
MTEQQVLYKLAALCSAAEHCSWEMLEKMRRWGIPDDAQARIMEYLTREKYVDDSRYCRFFVNDKLKYNGWGRRKIEQALYQKHIGRDLSDPVFDAVEDEQYLETLRPMAQRKWKSIKAGSDYERSMKLIRWAMGRGYSLDLIRKCIDNLSDIDL